MDQNQVPPAPPPYQPVTQHHNPYEFITNPPPPPKKGLLPGGGSKKMRLFIVLGGGFVLLMVFILLYGLLFSSNSQTADYLSLVRQQSEIVRVSDIGMLKARDAEAKNYAITTKLAIITQQSGSLELAKKAGADTSSKSLLLGKNTQTDAKLTAAEQANQFDGVFIATVQGSLEQYQQTLKKLYDGTSSKSTKETLMKYYIEVANLIPDRQQP